MFIKIQASLKKRTTSTQYRHHISYFSMQNNKCQVNRQHLVTLNCQWGSFLHNNRIEQRRMIVHYADNVCDKSMVKFRILTKNMKEWMAEQAFLEALLSGIRGGHWTSSLISYWVITNSYSVPLFCIYLTICCDQWQKKYFCKCLFPLFTVHCW